MQKNNYFILLLILCIFSFSSNAQSVSLPQASLDASPMGTVENSGETIARFTFSESSGVAVPSTALGLPNVTISVSFQYVELLNFDVNQISGNILDYFTPTYDSLANILKFEQSTEIPLDWYGFVEFPIATIQNSNSSQSYNGFNANISAVDTNTNAQGNASTFTYTDANVLSVVEFESLEFQALPNPTSGIINIKLQDRSDTTVQIIDLLGKVILTKEYTSFDKITLNIGNLQSAVYILKVTSDSGASNTVKIIKE